jgi:uroporphyrin-III C-methyltransferase/precorrin-2 dehydrogenase/sirohydrochlorin ferrochelatase
MPSAPKADRAYFAAFLDLKGRRAVVVGGGSVAALKAETLLRSGAQVTVVAPALCARLAELVVLGALRHEAKRFQPGDLPGADIAIAATDDGAVNELVSTTARALRIPVNVADNGALSTFIMPSVVDRSPLQIAISSAGTSPVLARKVRTLIEAAVPFGLGRLAQFIGRFRPLSKERLPDADRRRVFWEEVVDGSIGDLVLSGHEAGAEAALRRKLETGTASDPGFVSLVGAGPGDPELLTLRALRVMQRASVVLYDNLVSPALVDLVRRDAERIYVGKEQGNHALPQGEINALMVKLARAGHRVVRLKGGDPFIFGRGGEEIDALAAQEIPFEIVPGVTAAAGAAAYAGIPLTHRDCADACVFITGHVRKESSALDLRGVVRPRQTIVVYMGVGALGAVCEGLREQGLAASTPCAVVEKATLPGQRILEGTLATLPSLVAAQDVRPPALLIVGEVVRLRAKLAWYPERKPVWSSEI